MDIKIGADIEIWAKDQNGEVVPAYFAIGEDDIELPFGKLFPDGAACEFTVTPHVYAKEVKNRIASNIDAIQNILSKNNLYVGTESCATLGEKIFSVPIEYDETGHPSDRSRRICMLIYGCNPDMNIYNKEIKRPRPDKTDFRTLGGHIHIGLPKDILLDEDFDIFTTKPMIVLGLDLTLGIAASYAVNNPTDQKRRKLYGLPGTYRDKHYGLEYRPLPARALLSFDTEKILKTAQAVSEFVIRKMTNISYNKPVYEEVFGIEDPEEVFGTAMGSPTKGIKIADDFAFLLGMNVITPEEAACAFFGEEVNV